MRLVDWREADPAVFAPIWRELGDRWRTRLAWDSTSTWAQVEAARRDGALAGLVALDDAGVCGWTFFLLHRGTLQIGALEASTSDVARSLLDTAILAAGPDVAPEGVMLFGFSDAPGLVPALVARGFESDPYFYLVRDLVSTPSPASSFPWNADAPAQAPSLLARAYSEPSLSRPFARQGSAGEWQEYAAQMLAFGACGAFEPALSAALTSADGTLEGMVITTIVGDGTAHLAQVAVDPKRRGQGLGQALVSDVMAKAKRAGFERVSLLVSAKNTAALRIYERAGFRGTESFIAAGRRAMPAAVEAYPRRSTRPAFETGGASTLR